MKFEFVTFIMAGFDDAGVFFSDNYFGDNDQQDDQNATRLQMKTNFKDSSVSSMREISLTDIG